MAEPEVEDLNLPLISCVWEDRQAPAIVRVRFAGQWKTGRPLDRTLEWTVAHFLTEIVEERKVGVERHTEDLLAEENLVERKRNVDEVECAEN